MTEVGNPEIEALSPVQNAINSLQTNEAELLGIHLEKSEDIHHTNLRLSDKPEIQQVNDDDLLSQINDICGDDQEFPEPKSAASYEKESLESISEESLPNSNLDSLLNEEAGEAPTPKDQPSPLEDEENSLLVGDEDDEELSTDKNLEDFDDEDKRSPTIEDLPLDSKEEESSEAIIEDNLLSNGEDSQTKDMDFQNEDPEIHESDSKESESQETQSKGEEEESQSKDEDSQMKDVSPEDSLSKDDSETKTAVEDESNPDSEMKVSVENEPEKIDEEVEVEVEENQPMEVEVTENETPEEEIVDINAEKPATEEVSEINVEKPTSEGETEASTDIAEASTDTPQASTDTSQTNTEPAEKEVEGGEIQESEEAKRKRSEISPEKEKVSQEEPTTESEAKRLKPSENVAEDSDDEILFYPVTADSEKPKPAPPAPSDQKDEESDDEPIVFYKVPVAQTTPAVDDDDDIEIIEDTKEEASKENVADKVPETKEAPTTEKVEEPKEKEVISEVKTDEKKDEPVTETSQEKVDSTPKEDNKPEVVQKEDPKDDDSDDDIMIVEVENQVVSLTEDDPVEEEKKEEAPEVKKEEKSPEKKAEENIVPETKDTTEVKVKTEDQNKAPLKEVQKEPEPEKKVEPVAEDDKKSINTSDKENFQVDNSDNACDAIEHKPTKTEMDEAASNCTASSNLLKSGTKSAMDQEREDYGKAKRMRMSIDNDDLTSNMSSDTDVSQAYSSHSLKRSHSQSPSLADNEDSQSKKTKLSDEKLAEKMILDKNIVKKINKKLKKMTQQDLEHLVLQKIVESINYQSKISTLNEQLEKSHEKIEKFSQQYTNLKKQFNDLQLVHTRVSTDLEKRNTSYIMPIKITRAVGLQVSIGSKGSVPSADARNTYVVNSTGNTPVKPAATTASTSSQPSTPIANQSNQSTPSSASNQIRRGCVQKITPKRPVPVKPSTSPATASPITQSQQPPKLLNRSAPTTPTLPKSLIKTPSNTPSTQPSITIANLERNIQKLTASNPIVRHAATSVMKKTASGGPQTPKTMNTTGMKQLTPSVSIESVNSDTKPKGVIDLTDEDDAPPAPAQNSYNGIVTRQQSRPASQATPNRQPVAVTPTNVSYAVKIAPKPSQQIIQPRFKHPAPLPRVPEQKSLPHWKPIPPKPIIRINNSRAGIVISWAMEQSIDRFATITNYQIYAYQAPNDIAPSTEHWRYVDVVEAMLLPMAVTLTEFQEGLKYYFSVRAVDEYKRVGPFSLPRTWDNVKN